MTARRHRRWASSIALMVAGAAVAGVVARATVPAPQAPASPATARRAPELPTKASALAAASRWLSFNQSRRELLDPAHRHETVRRFVARDARQRIARRLDQAAAQLRTELTGPTATVRDAPIGYRLASFTPQEATVQTWEAVVRGGLNAPPRALLTTSTILLVWESGWRVQDVDIRVEPPAEWRASDLAAADQSYTSFRHVP